MSEHCRLCAKVDMSSSSTKQKPTVALVMKHLPEARNVARIFRKIGVLPTLYESLESFWNPALVSTPSLCIMDVRLIVEGEKALCRHPTVKSEELPLVFFYTSKCIPLLSSSCGMFSLGTVSYFDHDDSLLEGQIKSILRRVNRLGFLQIEREREARKAISWERRFEQLVQTSQNSKEEEYYRERLQRVWNALAPERNEGGDFYSALGKGLDSLKEVAEFSVVELAPNGQKLISPLSSTLGKNSRYREIPPLWLGKICDTGIEFFARNMAAQVALDLMGGEQLSLLIEGRSLHPEKMIFVKIGDRDFVKRFDWKRLELYLSDIWCYFSLKATPGTWSSDSSPKLHHPWEFFSLLDRVGFDEVSEEGSSPQWALIDGDFSNLLKTIRQKSPVRFYWEHFFNTFCNRFLADRVADIDCHLTCMGVGHIGLLVPVKRGEEIFKEFKSYSQRYPYWRYFEDMEIILAKEICPTVRMVPLSAEGYMGILEGSRSAFDHSPRIVREL